MGESPPPLQGEGLGERSLPTQVEPDLLKAALASPDQPLNFVVHLRPQADLGAASAQPTRKARRQAVVVALQAVANQTQGDLLAQLTAAQAKGKVVHVKPFWIINAVAVQADGATLLDLANRTDVEIIRANRRWRLNWSGPTETASARSVQAAGWSVQRIRADLVWSLLGFDGRGVVVANMDTGVDWQHADLQTAYRGYNPKEMPNHRGNWYCATDENYIYPGDGIGHGTHVMGTLVGQRGIGVAPGAQWIAVKVFDDDGYTTDAWLHDAFQWLIAPGGNPERAPDVVNGSWGSGARDSVVYRDDVRALRAADIMPVFSAGNDGPLEQSVGIPGGYPEALTVGASDLDNQAAAFSSRGPSPFAPIKPDVVAPGVRIRSTFHGGYYALSDGTSMATPHVAGLVALMRQARPDLTLDRIANIIRATARPIGNAPIPNNTVGAGLADAYGAVSVAIGAGEVSGQIRRAGDGGPVANAEVSVTEVISQVVVRVTTDREGRYAVPLRAGRYLLSVTAFGYAPVAPQEFTVSEGERVNLDVSLTLLPAGVVFGRITATSGVPLTATVIVEGAPVTTTAVAGTGLYSLALPPGTYNLRVEQRGYRIARASVDVPQAGTAVQRDFTLIPAPTILLVDSGGWYYADTATHYRAALYARDYLHDVYTVRASHNNAPSLDTLKQYNLVIWSSPRDAPSLVGGDRALANYLREGGRLIISGQDIAYWDGGGTGRFVAEYFRSMLNARYIADNAGDEQAQGAGPLAGETWLLNGSSSADNQRSVDVVGTVRPEPGSLSAVYRDGRGAGTYTAICTRHRALYFAFGLEGVRGLSERADLLDRAISLVAAPTPDRALSAGVDRKSEVAAAGSVISYTLTLRNIGAQMDAYRVEVEGNTWPTQIVYPSQGQPADPIELASCASSSLVVQVRIPQGLGWNNSDRVVVKISGVGDAPDRPMRTFVLESRTPAPVLLVDDDQWVNVQDVYTRALQVAGIPYDSWEIGHTTGDGRGSLPAERLALYPVVVWFTAYDFLDNLSTAEEARLAAYLNGGGRLLFSSQDYLFTSGLTRFGIDYLGVISYTEDLLSTTMTGARGDPIGNGLGPYPLDYARVFQSNRHNHSDVIFPTGRAARTFTGESGLPVGLRLDTGLFRTAFYAAPLEALEPEALSTVLRRSIGWLQPLGSSQMLADRAIVADGETLSYDVVVRNNGPHPRQAVQVDVPLPAHTQLVRGSLIGATLGNNRLSWLGALGSGESHGIRYQVRVSTGLPSGSQIAATATITDESGLSSQLWNTTRVNVPDLSPSLVTADRDTANPGGLVTFYVTLLNQGTLDATTSLTASLPGPLTILPETVRATTGETTVDERRVVWRGSVPRGRLPVALTFQARVAEDYRGEPLPVAVRIDDAFDAPLDKRLVIGATRRLFLPTILNKTRQ